MKTQKVGYHDLALYSHFARSCSVTPDWPAGTRQKAVKWVSGYCRRLGRALRHGLHRSIRFHELQTIDSYKCLL